MKFIHIPKCRSLVTVPRDEGIDKQVKIVSVLSHNIRGLPAWMTFNFDSEDRMLAIANYSNKYDIVLMQENFSYKRIIDDNSNHKISINDRRYVGLMPIRGVGSGLTVLSDKPYTQIIQKSFELCNGRIGSEFDCWADKGFIYFKLTLSDGTEIDVYNTHLDAGNSDADHEVRKLQLILLGESIKKLTSDDKPLIIGGDFNIPRDSILGHGILCEFRSELSLSDSQIALPDNEVDYIFYRSGDDVNIEIIESKIADEFNNLSDHPALSVKFSIN